MLIDILMILILAGFILSGYRKGLVMSLFSLVSTVIACLVASAAQHLLLEDMTGIITPLLTEYVLSALPEAGEMVPMVVDVIAAMLSGVLLFLIAFSLVYSLLHSVALAVNLAARLPVLSTINHLVGGVLGLCWGVLALLVALALVQSLEILPTDALCGPLGKLLCEVLAKIL